ncbi:hypothetical protein [Actinoplanes sp. NPDC026623]|uniref:hypothetical protein n=1 Tax=Actinoplanes sp. NPDC026623 TaxID=3155610 RepID=UPI0033C43767
MLAEFSSTRSKLSSACAHVRNKYGFEIELTFSAMPWATLAAAPSPVSGTPGTIWHLSVGGPDRWLDLQRLSRMIQPIREHIIYVFAGMPVGAQLAMPAVDDAPQVIDAMVHFVENYASCTVPLAKVDTEDADAWPGDISAIDSRILADHLFAIAQSPDDPGTPFGV